MEQRKSSNLPASLREFMDKEFALMRKIKAARKKEWANKNIQLGVRPGLK